MTHLAIYAIRHDGSCNNQESSFFFFFFFFCISLYCQLFLGTLKTEQPEMNKY